MSGALRIRDRHCVTTSLQDRQIRKDNANSWKRGRFYFFNFPTDDASFCTCQTSNTTRQAWEQDSFVYSTIPSFLPSHHYTASFSLSDKTLQLALLHCLSIQQTKLRLAFWAALLTRRFWIYDGVWTNKPLFLLTVFSNTKFTIFFWHIAVCK